MAYPLISSTSKGCVDTSDETSSAINTTGANLIVIGVSYLHGGTVPTFTDSRDGTFTDGSNSWTALPAVVEGTVAVKQYYCYSPTVGATHYFRCDSTSQLKSFYVQAFEGAETSPHEASSAGGTSGGATSLQPGNITTSSARLMVPLLGYRDGGTVSIDGSYIITGQMERTDNYIGGCAAYKLQTASGSENPTFSWSTSRYCAAAMQSFKVAASGGSSTTPLKTQHFHRR